jgi:short-subunit dehydrogenase
MSELFFGKRYLITGASSGFGEAYAHALHSLGANVVLVARREDRLRVIAEELNAMRAHSAEVLPIDLSKESDSIFGMRAIEEFLRRETIHGLINNAGFGSYGRFHDSDVEREAAMVRVNVIAPLRLTNAVLPQMINRHFGIIAHVASIAAFQPLPYMATYAATKSALLSLAISQHYELKQHNIRVLAVCPGPVKTEFGEVAQFPGEFGGRLGDTVDDVVTATVRGIERHRCLVIPGISGKLLGFAARCFSPQISVPLIERYIRPQ